MNIFKKIFFQIMYLQQPRWDTGITPPEVMAFLQNHSPGRALDLGCGTGTNAITLAQHGWQVTGVDFIGRAIRQARRKAHHAGLKINFWQDDVTRLRNVRPPFDLVLDIGCFHSLDEKARQTYILNLPRLLAPGGTFLLYAFFKTSADQSNGLQESDLELLNQTLRQVERLDGSERGLRPSAWFTYAAP